MYILLTEDVSNRFSLELVLSSFLNLFCSCNEQVDLRNAGGGGIKRGLFGKGIDSLIPPVQAKGIKIRQNQAPTQ
jgi:hypothetical protein